MFDPYPGHGVPDHWDLGRGGTSGLGVAMYVGAAAIRLTRRVRRPTRSHSLDQNTEPIGRTHLDRSPRTRIESMNAPHRADDRYHTNRARAVVG